MAPPANDQARPGKCPICKIDLSTYQNPHQRQRHRRRCERKHRFSKEQEANETLAEREERTAKEADRARKAENERLYRQQKREEAEQWRVAAIESAPAEDDDSKKAYEAEDSG